MCYLAGKALTCVPLLFNLPTVKIEQLEQARQTLSEESHKGFFVALGYALTMTTTDPGWAENMAIALIDKLLSVDSIDGFHERAFGEDRTFYTDVNTFKTSTDALARSLGGEEKSDYWIIQAAPN